MSLYDHNLIASMNNPLAAGGWREAQRQWRERNVMAATIHTLRTDIIERSLKFHTYADECVKLEKKLVALVEENRALHEELGDYVKANIRLADKIDLLDRTIDVVSFNNEQLNEEADRRVIPRLIAAGMFLVSMWTVFLMGA